MTTGVASISRGSNVSSTGIGSSSVPALPTGSRGDCPSGSLCPGQARPREASGKGSQSHQGLMGHLLPPWVSSSARFQGQGLARPSPQGLRRNPLVLRRLPFSVQYRAQCLLAIRLVSVNVMTSQACAGPFIGSSPGLRASCLVHFNHVTVSASLLRLAHPGRRGATCRGGGVPSIAAFPVAGFSPRANFRLLA